MSFETTPIGNFNNQQSFRDAFNIADQPIKDPLEKEKFLKLLSELDQAQIMEILIDCNHSDALPILFQKYSYLTKTSIIKLALSKTRNKYVEHIKLYLDPENLIKKGNLLLERLFKAQDKSKTYFGCLITNDILEIYLDVYQKSLLYLEKYQKTLSEMIRSSFWHDHSFKYPLPDFKVCLMFQPKEETEVNLVAIMDHVYTGSLKTLTNPYLTQLIDLDHETIYHQNFSVYLLGRYYFKKNDWFLKFTVKFEDQLNLIKCQKCRRIINEMTTRPPEKTIHKFNQEETCLQCLKKNRTEYNPDDYYSDWAPMQLEKWQISGSDLLFMIDQESSEQVIQKSSEIKKIGPFEYRVILDPTIYQVDVKKILMLRKMKNHKNN